MFANLNDFLHYNGQISEYGISLPLRKGKCVFSTINTIFKENTFYAKGKLTKAYSGQTHGFGALMNVMLVFDP